MSEYNGWKNRATWNCSLWLNNDQAIYEGAVEFMKDYKGIAPYRSFMRTCGLQGQRTGDGILWVSQILDFEALNAMMWELAPQPKAIEEPEYEEETAQCTRCQGEVPPETLVAYGDWELCEACQGDI